jgi:hypothetical protein
LDFVSNKHHIKFNGVFLIQFMRDPTLKTPPLLSSTDIVPRHNKILLLNKTTFQNIVYNPFINFLQKAVVPRILHEPIVKHALNDTLE